MSLMFDSNVLIFDLFCLLKMFDLDGEALILALLLMLMLLLLSSSSLSSNSPAFFPVFSQLHVSKLSTVCTKILTALLPVTEILLE